MGLSALVRSLTLPLLLAAALLAVPVAAQAQEAPGADTLLGTWRNQPAPGHEIDVDVTFIKGAEPGSYVGTVTAKRSGPECVTVGTELFRFTFRPSPESPVRTLSYTGGGKVWSRDDSPPCEWTDNTGIGIRDTDRDGLEPFEVNRAGLFGSAMYGYYGTWLRVGSPPPVPSPGVITGTWRNVLPEGQTGPVVGVNVGYARDDFETPPGTVAAWVSDPVTGSDCPALTEAAELFKAVHDDNTATSVAFTGQWTPHPGTCQPGDAVFEVTDPEGDGTFDTDTLRVRGEADPRFATWTRVPPSPAPGPDAIAGIWRNARYEWNDSGERVPVFAPDGTDIRVSFGPGAEPGTYVGTVVTKASGPDCLTERTELLTLRHDPAWQGRGAIWRGTGLVGPAAGGVASCEPTSQVALQLVDRDGDGEVEPSELGVLTTSGFADYGRYAVWVRVEEP
jgi:hypothetical protein